MSADAKAEAFCDVLEIPSIARTPRNKKSEKKGVLARTRFALGFATVPFGLALGHVDQAEAAFRVCNQSVTLYNVAIGAEIDKKFATEGWWTLPGNTCVTPIKEDLSDLKLRYVYIYATTATGDSAFEGNWDMCVDTKRFKIEKVQDQPWDCWVRGFVQAKFKEVDTGDTGSWTVFIRPDDKP
ncbi:MULTISPECIES: DUF1036 domain-containing protein [Labrys]|jgi:uncharacterized membrane protein|uniref:DUF1036 domain-containing protein n=1 Tax=Labrys TaxID=204476 RepID=UPI0009EF2072|nr:MULTISPECIES: DUF1036 domain-containing protein [unclassified Labrys (in: a-proteobacteria)]MDZ5451284.1 DUF1036 domain-containing protein [Labrys sp. ZIDIC5]